MNDAPRPAKPITILLADDSADDRLMTRDVLEECFVIVDMREVADGEALRSRSCRES